MQREFLITNSLGGYCSSDYKLGNTRKYHGLLVAANHDLTRVNIVNRIEEWLEINSKKYPLSSSLYKGNVLSPDGSEFIESFSIDKYPTWIYRIDNITIEKSYVLNKGVNKLTARYKITNDGAIDAKLELSPFITHRSVDELNTITDDDKYTHYIHPDHLILDIGKRKFVKVNFAGFEYSETQSIYYDFYYPIEEQRGYPSLEDLEKIGDFTVVVPPGESTFKISFEYYDTKPTEDVAQDVFEAYDNYTENLLIEFYNTHNLARSEFVDNLLVSADSFIVNSIENTAILAGYHWFGEWGRDTFMSFTGLLLKTDRIEEAKAILLKWNNYFKDGLLPNLPFFGNYESLDGVLWYSVALWNYYNKTKDVATVKKILPNLEDTLVSFTMGAQGIKEEGGYLVNSNYDKALTWMDAQVEGVPVTNRAGKAVEIQALWFNFLKIILFFKEEVNDLTYISQIQTLISKLTSNFEKDFWNENEDCLYDLISGDYKDPAIRPNQVMVTYLPFELLGKRRAKRMLETVKNKLLTQVGLKTLNAENENYHGSYQGEQKLRDQAYHQGTIWPFWTGAFLISYIKQHNYSLQSIEFAKSQLDQFIQALNIQGLRYIPEIFEADTLRADGCLSQAWSVAYTLELISEIALNT